MILLDGVIRWVIDRIGVPKDGVHPRWWCRMVDASLDRWTRTFFTQLFAADATGVGLIQDWLPPGAMEDDILRWFDTAITHAPRVPVLIDMVSATLIDLREEEVALAQHDTPIHVGEERLLAKWEGTRQEWWLEGRDYVRAAIPPDHRGLGVVSNALARVWINASLR